MYSKHQLNVYSQIAAVQCYVVKLQPCYLQPGIRVAAPITQDIVFIISLVKIPPTMANGETQI